MMNRRRLLTVGVATVVAAEWHTPIIKSVVLPAHAQTSVELVPPDDNCGGDLEPPCNPLPESRCEIIDDSNTANPDHPDFEAPSQHCRQCEQLADDSRDAASRGDQDASDSLEELYGECSCQIYETDLGGFCPQLDPLQ